MNSSSFFIHSKSMGKTRGFRLSRKLVKVLQRFIHRRTRRISTVYRPLKPSTGPISKLCKWVHSLSLRRVGSKVNSGYIQLGRREPAGQVKLPKGHLAVYVGDKEDDTCRVMVPVIYFNHPLFSELLREAENVYGFCYPGRIQIPCPKSELENVQMKIAASSGGGIWRRWQS